MTPDRRTVTFGLLATALSACAGGGVGPRPAVAMQAVPNAGYDAWLAAFRGRARARGVTQATLDSALAQAGYLPGVIERDGNQAEFTRTLEDYLAIAASDERVSDGRAKLRQHRATLEAIEARYGVSKEIVTAVWGLESNYGTRRGDIPVVSSASTLAFDGRRGAFFEAQLIAALKIVQNGDTTADRMIGSWAGAMGHTQFIPTSYEAFAVDFDGDGRRDIWSDDPTDALASTAAYLDRSGWQTGRPWGVEVRLPGGFSGPFGRGSTRSTAQWAAAGVRNMAGGTVPDHGPASIIIPQGAAGPAFMTFRNFTAITRYNNAESYVIGVGHLADRIGGGPRILGSFPPDAEGFSIEDRRALQRGLTAAGFDTGGTDGVIGPNTRAAIAGYQRANGLAPSGLHSRAMLTALGG